jgi:tetratricopeptide (TPR) repeat protein
MSWRDNLQVACSSLPSDVQRAFKGLAVASLFLVVLSFFLPPEYQLPAVLALFGVFAVVQVLILRSLWLRNPALRKARKHYMARQFEDAVQVLEDSRLEAPQDAAGLSLLGNAYRQMGDLARSEEVLRQAYEKDPDAPFAAYGLGRTLLVMGIYEDAVRLIEHALDRRGQRVILADLGLALFRAGRFDEAGKVLSEADTIELEPYRALMTRYLLWRLSNSAVDDAARRRLERYDHGLETWHAEAVRFGETPYGQALAEDIAQIEQILQKGS